MDTVQYTMGMVLPWYIYDIGTALVGHRHRRRYVCGAVMAFIGLVSVRHHLGSGLVLIRWAWYVWTWYCHVVGVALT